MTTPSKFRFPLWLNACVVGAIAVILLWEDHRSHILGVVPYLVLLMCPLIHFFMHRGQAHDESERGASTHVKG